MLKKATEQLFCFVLLQNRTKILNIGADNHRTQTNMKQGILALLSAIVVATSGLSAQETEIPAVMTKKEMRRTMWGYKAFYEIGYDFDSRAAGERFADVSNF